MTLENGKATIQTTLDNTPQPLVSQIYPKNYGENVIYNFNGLNNLKIFYKDSSNVFLISSGYLNMNIAPSIEGVTFTPSEIETNNTITWDTNKLNYTRKPRYSK